MELSALINEAVYEKICTEGPIWTQYVDIWKSRVLKRNIIARWIANRNCL